MTDIPNISQAEWRIMKILWAKAPLAATEVYEALAGKQEWHPKTVRTLLGRLVEKGALEREKKGGVLRFMPVISEAECLREESQSFMERCFGGALRPMLAHFLEQESLAPDDIAALRTLLDKQADTEDPK